MYVPNVNIFYEKYGKKKTVEELVNQPPPSQPELLLCRGDITSAGCEDCVQEGKNEKIPPFEIELALICRKNAGRGFFDIGGVLAVFDGGRQKTACAVELPKGARRAALNAFNSGGRRRKGFVRLPVKLAETPSVHTSDNGKFCIREFEVSVMGEPIKDAVYREWWEMQGDDGRAVPLGLELGARFSLHNWEKLKKEPRLLLD